MAAGALGQTLVPAVPSAIKPDNASVAPVTWTRTAKERTSMECNRNKSSAVTASVMVCYNNTASFCLYVPFPLSKGRKI